MLTGPLKNATLAALYIVLIVFIMDSISSGDSVEPTILIPMVVLSLLVLSVAIMGFLFAYEPFRLYFDNKRSEALVYFAKTVGFFACFALIFVFALFYVSF